MVCQTSWIFYWILSSNSDISFSFIKQALYYDCISKLYDKSFMKLFGCPNGLLDFNIIDWFLVFGLYCKCLDYYFISSSYSLFVYFSFLIIESTFVLFELDSCFVELYTLHWLSIYPELFC
jgi:hypothetical protein